MTSLTLACSIYVCGSLLYASTAQAQWNRDSCGSYRSVSRYDWPNRSPCYDRPVTPALTRVLGPITGFDQTTVTTITATGHHAGPNRNTDTGPNMITDAVLAGTTGRT